MTSAKQWLNQGNYRLRRWVKGFIPALRRAKYSLLTRWWQLNNSVHGAAPRQVEWHFSQNPPENCSFKQVFPPYELTWKGAECGPALRPHFPELVTKILPEVTISDMRNVQLIGVRGSIGIWPALIDSRNRLVSDYSFDPYGLENQTVFSKFRLPPEQKIGGLSALLYTINSEDNYYHFTMDLLPKLHVLAAAGYPLERFDHFIISRCAHPFQKELLQMAGVPLEKLTIAHAEYNYSIDHLIATPIVYTENGFAPWRLNYLRGLVEKGREKTTRRLFITRRSASNRRLLNEDELLANLGPLGFETIDCGQFSVREQARIFQEASVIVGVHGAALTNLIHCAPGTRLIEIMNVKSTTLYFNSISTMLNLDHQIIEGYPPNAGLDLEQHRMHREDYVVNIDDVLRALDRVKATAGTRPSP